MSVKTKYYIGTPNGTWITDSELAYVTILKVTRSGTVFTKTGAESAESLRFIYSPSIGRIYFSADNPFGGFSGGRPQINLLEKVSVKFKV